MTKLVPGKLYQFVARRFEEEPAGNQVRPLRWAFQDQGGGNEAIRFMLEPETVLLYIGIQEIKKVDDPGLIRVHKFLVGDKIVCLSYMINSNPGKYLVQP